MKIKISKSQWHKIGKITKWASGEVIEIDGKFYNENMEEISNPNLAKSKVIEFNINGEVVILEEGKNYKNYFGNYLLKSIEGLSDPKNAKIIVQYLDGQFKNETRSYPAKSQAEAIHSEQGRIIREQEDRQGIDIIKFSTLAEYFTLGYLAKNSRIIVEVPSDPIIMLKFENKYRELTGEEAKNHLQDGSYYIAPKQESRWRARCRLTFAIKDSVVSKLSFPSDISINNNLFEGDILGRNIYLNNSPASSLRLGSGERLTVKEKPQ